MRLYHAIVGELEREEDRGNGTKATENCKPKPENVTWKIYIS
jgi:hypothetical protein